MGKYWKPEGDIARIIPARERGREDWMNPESYVDPARRSWPVGATVAIVLLGAAALGLAVGLHQGARSADAGDRPVIEWNAVQAAPTRAPDAEDVEWEKRAKDGSVIASDSDANQEMPTVVRGHAANAPQAARPTIYAFDGDTFDMGGQRIRVANIDAPELHPSRCAEEQRLGLAAKDKLSALLSSGTVTMSGAGHDQYGRELRNVQVNGQDVGEAMIGTGLAREYGRGRRSWC